MYSRWVDWYQEFEEMEIIKTHHGKETLRTIKFMDLFRHFFLL